MEHIKIFGHTIEFKESGMGSLDPWSADYAHEQNVSLMGTDDMASFALIDGERVFRIKNNITPLYNELKEAVENDKIDSWDGAFDIFSKHVDSEFEPLSKSKHDIDIIKMRQEKLKKTYQKRKRSLLGQLEKRKGKLLEICH